MDSPADRVPTTPDALSTVHNALDVSNLRSLPHETRESLISTGHVFRIPAGATLHREGDATAHLQLVLSGLLRVFVTALDGRTLTVRYCRKGSVLGAVSLFAKPFTMPASVKALTDAHMLALSAPAVAREAERDLVVAGALIEELSDRVMSFIAEIPSSAFATVRQRVARHLLDLASVAQRDPVLTVTMSQTELADAVGSVREVVVRVLRDLREEGYVTTGHGIIELLEPEHLASEAYPTVT